ncbi:hypothetical protein ID0090_14360 [Helicobacter pylori]|nr:hypothetical protein KVC37_06625 [Helicobacter pylori]
MKKDQNESNTTKSIIEVVTEVTYKKAEKMLNDYPKLEAENTELRRKCEEFKSENQELKAENVAQQQLNDLQQQLIKSQNETIEALKRESDANRIIIELLTKENYRDEEEAHSKSCLGLE